MTIEIVSVTGISGVGKTHTIKPLAEADNNTQYIDLLSSEIPSLTSGSYLVIDHVGFENDQTIRLIEEARSKNYKGVLLIGQDTRDFEWNSFQLDWSIELLGSWKDLSVRITKDGKSHTYTRQELDSFNKLIH